MGLPELPAGFAGYTSKSKDRADNRHLETANWQAFQLAEVGRLRRNRTARKSCDVRVRTDRRATAYQRNPVAIRTVVSRANGSPQEVVGRNPAVLWLSPGTAGRPPATTPFVLTFSRALAPRLYCEKKTSENGICTAPYILLLFAFIHCDPIGPLVAFRTSCSVVAIGAATHTS
jgi:hypothetical protein